MDLAQCKAVTVIVQANPSQTLSGGGTLQLWILDNIVDSAGSSGQKVVSLGWMRAFDLDLSMTSKSGVQTVVFPALRIPVRGGQRLLVQPNGVTVSGGTDVLIKMVGFDGMYPS